SGEREQLAYVDDGKVGHVRGKPLEQLSPFPATIVARTYRRARRLLVCRVASAARPRPNSEIAAGSGVVVTVAATRFATTCGPKQLLHGPSLSTGPPRKLMLRIVPSLETPAVHTGVKLPTVPQMSCAIIDTAPCCPEKENVAFPGYPRSLSSRGEPEWKNSPLAEWTIASFDIPGSTITWEFAAMVPMLNESAGKDPLPAKESMALVIAVALVF